MNNFSNNIEYNKPQRTFYSDPEGFLAVTVEIMRALFGAMTLLKTQFFEKKGNRSSEKKLCSTLSRILECDKSHGTNFKGRKGTLTITAEVIRSFP